MRKIITPLALLALLAALACGGCAREAAKTETATADHEETAEAHAHGETEAEAEASDLDQPVEALFEASCEHGVKTHACDECRYEVGVARAPAALFEGGLLREARPVREAVRVPLALTGEVRFDDRRVAHLAPAASGTVRRVAVTVGDHVRRGQVLVEIDSGDAAAAAAELREATSLLALAEAGLERTRRLREQDIAAEKDFRAATQAAEAARIRVETARAQAARLGAGDGGNSAGGDGARAVLRSSVDGTVLFLHAVAGEPAGPDEVMATVGDVASVWVWADLYERDLAKLAPTPLPAVLRVRGWPDREFPGTVDFISPSVDEATRTIKLRVTADNPDGKLMAGMFANVDVLLPGDEQALVLPAAAVLEDEGRRFVFIRHHDDFFVRRPVTTGRAWGDRVEITGGLNGDESVVAEGAFLLKSDVLRSKMGAGCAD